MVLLANFACPSCYHLLLNLMRFKKYMDKKFSTLDDNANLINYCSLKCMNSFESKRQKMEEENNEEENNEEEILQNISNRVRNKSDNEKNNIINEEINNIVYDGLNENYKGKIIFMRNILENNIKIKIFF